MLPLKLKQKTAQVKLPSLGAVLTANLLAYFLVRCSYITLLSTMCQSHVRKEACGDTFASV